MAQKTLSKSQYLVGRNCPLALWKSQNRDPFNRAAGDPPPVAGVPLQARDQGQDVGEIAKRVYPGGVEVKGVGGSLQKAAELTIALIDAGHDVIFEAVAIRHDDGTRAALDILRRVPGSDEWDMIEVKSGASLKDYYLADLAFQYHVFTGAGYKIRNAYLMHVNSKYVRKGKIDPAQMFVMRDLTEKVIAQQPETAARARSIRKVIMIKQAPEQQIGSHCNNPRPCHHKKDCWKDVPLYSLFNVLTAPQAASVGTRNGGDYDISQLPAEFTLRRHKELEVLAHKSGHMHVDHAQLDQFMRQLEYPLYYLDYEAVMSAIPLYEGTRPYESVPFQFALHIQEQPGGPLVAHHYIHRRRTDPRVGIAAQVARLCGTQGSVIVYNRQFETDCNNRLAGAFPRLRGHMQAINARMIDLHIPFENRWVYHPGQNGRTSLKNVLAAHTGHDYKDFEIRDGEQAMNLYRDYVLGRLNPPVAGRLWPALEEYCGLDSRGMAMLVDALRGYVARGPAPTPPCPV